MSKWMNQNSSTTELEEVKNSYHSSYQGSIKAKKNGSVQSSTNSAKSSGKKLDLLAPKRAKKLVYNP